MRLKNIRIIILVLLIGIGFASCEDREFRQASTFKVEFDAFANPNTGYFEETRRIGVSSQFFSNFNDSRDEVRDIRFFEGWIEIGNLVRDDRIYEINIDLNGRRIYRNTRGWAPGGKEYIWIGDDVALDNAIMEILHAIGGNRAADVTIYGKSNLMDEGPLEVDLMADVELLIRD